MSVKPEKLTPYFILIMIAIIAVFDVWAFMQAGTEGTISWTIYGWSEKYSAFNFAVGFVMGHLFWQMKKKKSIKD